MPNNQRKTAAKPRKMPRKIVVLIILLLVFVTVVFAALNYRAQETRQREAEAALAADKASFARVEADMAQTYEAMVAAAGKPDKEEQFKNCSRTAHKLDEGTLWCNTGYQFSYEGIESDQTAIQLMRQLEGRLKQAGYNISKHSQTSDDLDGGSKIGSQSVQVRLEPYHGFSCDLYSEYRRMTSPSLINAEFQFRCAKDVSQPIYTLAQ